MAEIWPATVPHCRLLDTTETLGDPRLRSEPDAGPALVRARTSAVVNVQTGQIKVTEAQWQDILTFGQTTLLGWSLPFLFPDVDGELMRFGERLPSRSRIASDRYLVDLTFEILP